MVLNSCDIIFTTSSLMKQKKAKQNLKVRGMIKQIFPLGFTHPGSWQKTGSTGVIEGSRGREGHYAFQMDSLRDHVVYSRERHAK